METIYSTDGTPIAYERTGAGSPLVLVHGTSADHTRWAPVLPALEQHFSVYAIDRRGRGGSGDTDDYSIEREFEDVVAAVDSITEPVNLLGHSFGGICALEAALRTAHLRQLILYEPPIPTGVQNVYPLEVVAKMQKFLEAGDRDGVVTTFMRDIVHVPPHELELLRSAPAWKGRIAAAHTILRELNSTNQGYAFDPKRFKNLRTPTLLLLGGDSPAFLKAATETLNATLPNSRILVMPGQQHTAMNTAPDLFVREVLTYLTSRAEPIPEQHS
jgi:pimeloyl-ACP methyl ester carboxylesterase